MMPTPVTPVQSKIAQTLRPQSSANAATRIRRLAWLLDNSIRLPGGFRIGWDGLIGLVPGIGDVVAALLSSYIVVEAARMKVGGSVLMRMVGNIALELGVGLVPLAGDLFDFAFKANTRNVKLLEAYLDQPVATRRRSRWHVRVALLTLALVVCAVLALAGGLLWLGASALNLL